MRHSFGGLLFELLLPALAIYLAGLASAFLMWTVWQRVNGRLPAATPVIVVTATPPADAGGQP